MVETATKEVPQSIAIKGYNSDSIASKKSKGSKNAFADFIKDLGKTTAQKSAESSAPNSTEMFKKVSTSDATNEVQKTELLSNLLKGKNEEVKSEKVAQSPLDSILQRPKATHSKLNATPEIKQPKESSESQSGRFNNRDAVLRSLKGTNISFADSPQDSPKFIKTAENGTNSANNRAIPSVSDLESAGQNMAKNNATNADLPDLKTAQDLAKDSPLAPKNAPTSSKAPNIAQQNEKRIEPKINELKTETTKAEATNAELKPSATNTTSENDAKLPNVAQLLQDTAQDSEITPNATPNQSQNAPSATNQVPNIAQKPTDSADLQKDSQETAPNITKEQSTEKPQNFARLGIANTLKYGAFKAFDALSLLKPSDGKKLSELIKKADELSLNLQSVKYVRMVQTPLSENYFANQLANAAPKIEPKAQSPLDLNAQNLAQSATNSANQSQIDAPQQDSALAKALSEVGESKKPQDSNKSESPKNEAVKADDKQSAKLTAQDTKDLQNKNVAQNNNQNIAKDSPQNAPQTPESKAIEPKAEQPKIAESKVPESKTADLKATEPQIEQSKVEQSPKNDANITQAQNSDLKPISFKPNEQKIATPKGEASGNQSAIQPNNSEASGADSQNHSNLANAESSQKVEQLGSKLFDARETMRHFANSLRSEIQNYKPPLTKITLELQPANLGSVEVSIISQGKNIQIQLNAPQNTLNLFIQNQSDLRTALSQIGYDNVAMSFSNGSQMGFSDNSGKWRYESNANKFRNNFGLKNVQDSQDENEVFEIMITNNYA